MYIILYHFNWSLGGEFYTQKYCHLPKERKQDPDRIKLKECIQRDRGCSIPGAPVGCDFEIGEDYSMGKWEKFYGNKV
mgnify:CR=1 FL=1